MPDYQLNLCRFISDIEGFRDWFSKYYFLNSSTFSFSVRFHEIGYDYSLCIPRIIREIIEKETGMDLSGLYGDPSEIILKRFRDFLNSCSTEDFIAVLSYFFEEADSLNANLISTIENKINSPLFALEFEVRDGKLQKKIDSGTTNVINSINDSLINSNKEIYETCVVNYFTYSLKRDNNWRHEELDRMIGIFQNCLVLYHGIPEGKDLFISHKKPINDLIFSNSNQEFLDFLDFIIKNFHHDKDGQRITINNKMFNYMWLELNKLIYLTIQYGKANPTSYFLQTPRHSS
jgi:hypothetical protein